jgi:hypothetical protein
MTGLAIRRRGRALWLPDVLRDAGLPVQVVPEFAVAGKDPNEWLAIVDHHDASNRRAGNLGALETVRRGRPDVPGPLANLTLTRDGVHICVASGAANHPGVSYLPHRGGISSGVKYWALGREIALDGIGEPFPVGGRQYEAMIQGNAAICIYLGLQPGTDLWDHKSICRPAGRKIDVRPYDLTQGRARCARRMTGTPAASPTNPTTVPTEDPDMALAYRFPDRKVWLCTGTHREHITSTRALEQRAIVGLVAPVPADDPNRETQWIRRAPAAAIPILTELEIVGARAPAP